MSGEDAWANASRKLSSAHVKLLKKLHGYKGLQPLLQKLHHCNFVPLLPSFVISPLLAGAFLLASPRIVKQKDPFSDIATLAIRKTHDPLGLVGSIRDQSRTIDQNQAVTQITTDGQILSEGR